MTTALPHPRTADGSIATSADLEAIAAPLADRGRIASYADLLTVIIQALEAWDIEPEPRSVGPCGFTVKLGASRPNRVRNHHVLVRTGRPASRAGPAPRPGSTPGG